MRSRHHSFPMLRRPGRQPRAFHALGVIAQWLVCLLLSAPPLAAQETAPVDNSSDMESLRDLYFTFYLDNDLFSGTDRNYTNGFRLSVIGGSESSIKGTPRPKILERLAQWHDDGGKRISRWSGFESETRTNPELRLNYGVALTQLIFTPEDPEPTGQPPGQRRYAGWLGLGFSVHASDRRALNSAELILGTTGPRSLAEDAQDLVHEIRGIPEFQGWDDQVPNEFTLDLVMTQKRRLPRKPWQAGAFGVDGFAEASARLGTFRTGARIGGFLRAGMHLPQDFSDPRLSVVAYSHQPFKAMPGRGSSADWSLYALLGANVGAVLFDATLDGPLFKNFDTGNTREPWVAEAYLGFGWRWKTVEFSYVHTWRSREYEEQDAHTEFGSVAVRLRFPFGTPGRDD